MTVSQQSSRSGPGTENNDEDFTRPENLIQTGFVYQTAPGSGTLPGTMRTVTTGTMVLRSDLKFDVAPQWAVAFRGDPPISAKNPITSDNPTGEFAEGLGDADVQAALIKPSMHGGPRAQECVSSLPLARRISLVASGRRCRSSAPALCCRN